MSQTDFDGRKRYLLSDPYKEKVCLNDVIEKFAECSEQIRHLEYKDTPHALKQAKKVIREAELVFLDFKARLKTEITEEVAEAKAAKPKGVFNTKKENNEYLWD